MRIIGGLTIMLFLVSFFGVEQGPDACLQEFKEGTFYYYNGTEIVEIKRTATHQYEKFGNTKTESKLTWIGDDSYELRLASTNKPGCLNIGDRMTVTLSACTPDFYTATITSELCGGGDAQIFRDKKNLQKALKNYTE
ncbi:MAG: hypothetical protein GQ574_09680 [Crocinitomix sp.]|nr:hypothetical protein [Crocinitomix sp.]